MSGKSGVVRKTVAVWKSTLAMCEQVKRLKRPEIWLPLDPSYQSVVVSKSKETASRVDHTLKCCQVELSGIVCT
jgi:hypothetical protein